MTRPSAPRRIGLLLSLSASALSWAASPASPPPIAGALFGQKDPGPAPEPFAPEALARFNVNRTPVFSTDGGEVFWSESRGRFRSALMTSRLVDGVWNAPRNLRFSTGDAFDHNPALSADGRLLVFASDREVAGKARTTLPGTPVPTSDLWMAERKGDDWGDPRLLGAAFATPYDDDIPLLAADGTLYFTSSRPGGPGPGGIYTAARTGDGWAEPVLLPAPVNSAAGEMLNYVSPDQRLLVFWSLQRDGAPGMYAAIGSRGQWRAPVRFDETVSRMRPYFARLSPGGGGLMFTSAVSGKPVVYWLDARALEALRPLFPR